MLCFYNDVCINAMLVSKLGSCVVWGYKCQVNRISLNVRLE